VPASAPPAEPAIGVTQDQRETRSFRGRASGPVWRAVPGRRQGSNAGARSTSRSFASLLDTERISEPVERGHGQQMVSAISKGLTHVDSGI
jgi:hypothetical protein